MIQIVYTITDEAPQLATYSLLPVVRRFTEPVGVKVEASDISLAARVLAQFPEAAEQDDCLAGLGVLSLRNNGIGDEGAAALAEALRGNTGLTELDLSGNDISDAVADEIAAALAANQARRDAQRDATGRCDMHQSNQRHRRARSILHD